MIFLEFKLLILNQTTTKIESFDLLVHSVRLWDIVAYPAHMFTMADRSDTVEEGNPKANPYKMNTYDLVRMRINKLMEKPVSLKCLCAITSTGSSPNKIGVSARST